MIIRFIKAADSLEDVLVGEKHKPCFSLKVIPLFGGFICFVCVLSDQFRMPRRAFVLIAVK